MAEKVRFSPNVTEEVTLQYAEPKEYPSQFGEGVEYLFTLADGRIMYLPRKPKELIEALGIGAGERVQITKTLTNKGQRRINDWEVRRVDPPHAPVHTQPERVPAAPAATPSALRQAHQQSGQVQNQDIARPVPPMPQARPPQPADPGAGLRRCFRLAIQELRTAREYAAEQGLDFKFGERDVISVAMSLYINAAKGGLC